MPNEIIGFKELRTNLTRIGKQAEKGHGFLVMKHNRPLFRIQPIEHTDNKAETLFDAFKDVRFSGGDPNLSKHIDDIVYGLS